MTARSLKHKFTSAISDSADTTLVRPTNWNDDHDFYLGINAQTGTNYAIANADQWSLITFSNASAVAVSIAQAGAASSFLTGWTCYLRNLGAGTVTVTPTTSTVAVGVSAAASSFTLLQGEDGTLVSDGTNYIFLRGTMLQFAAAATITSSSASALAVGRQGATQPAFQVDASAGSSVTGVKITAAANGSGVGIAAISQGSNEDIKIDGKGTGKVTIGGTSTGNIELQRALVYGGVTLNNAVTGTGNMVLSSAPTFTGNVTFDTNTLVIDATNNRVGIGLASPDYTLEVIGDSLFFENYLASSISGVTTRQNDVIALAMDTSVSGSGNALVARWSQAITSGSGNLSSGAHVVGAKGESYHNGTGTLGLMIGVEGAVQNASTGTLTEGRGVMGFFQGNPSGKTITNWYGVCSMSSQSNAGTITRWADFYSEDLGTGGSGTITARYSLLNEDALKLIQTAGAVAITKNTASVSTATGALVVTGGVGVGGALNVGAASTIQSATSYAGLTINGVAIATGLVFSNSGTAQSSVFDDTAVIAVASNAARTQGMYITHGASTWSAISDARLPYKRSARDITNSLPSLADFHLYERTDGVCELFAKAQEFHALFPHIVKVGSGDDNYEPTGMSDPKAWSIAYDRSGMIALAYAKKHEIEIDKIKRYIDLD